MIKRPAKTASKDQILAAFDQLHAEYKRLEADAKSRVAASASSAKAAPAVSDQSIEGIIVSLEGLRAGFGDAVSTLSADLVTEATQLQALRQQAQELETQLEELHGLKVAEDTLQKVLQEYQDKSVAFQRELTEKKESFERNMAERIAAWKQEQEEHSRFVKDRDETTKKAQQRGVEEYDYDLQQRRKLEVDAHEQGRLKLQREVDFEVATREKQWAEREKQVAELEKLYNDYKAEFEAYPSKLEAAVKKAKSEGQAIANSQAKIKADLAAKEYEGERKVADLQIKNLEASIKERAARIDALSAQLAQALKQGQDLAVKAIEGASNASTFGAVKEIALEQAKNLPKSK